MSMARRFGEGRYGNGGDINRLCASRLQGGRGRGRGRVDVGRRTGLAGASAVKATCGAEGDICGHAIHGRYGWSATLKCCLSYGEQIRASLHVNASDPPAMTDGPRLKECQIRQNHTEFFGPGLKRPSPFLDGLSADLSLRRRPPPRCSSYSATRRPSCQTRRSRQAPRRADSEMSSHSQWRLWLGTRRFPAWWR